MTKEPEAEVFSCQHCGNRASHKIIGRHTQEVDLGFQAPNGDKIFAQQYYVFFECTTCRGITIKTIFSEEIDDPSEINFDRVSSLYPQEKEFPDSMPETIVSCYEEAKKVKKVSTLAFSILIRRALEAMFIEQGIGDGDLFSKIEKMAKKAGLPNTFIKMSDSIRLFGNSGAHQLDVKISPEQADILDYFFIALVEYLYIAPDKITKTEESLKKIGKKINNHS